MKCQLVTNLNFSNQTLNYLFNEVFKGVKLQQIKLKDNKLQDISRMRPYAAISASIYISK